MENRRTIKINTREYKRRVKIARGFAFLGVAASVLALCSKGLIAGLIVFAGVSLGVAALNPMSHALGFRNQLKLPAFNSVGSNQRATLDVPLGLAYHDIIFNIQDGGVDMTIAQIKARIDSIVVKINGKPVQEWTPTTLDIVNSTNGAAYAMINGWARLFFSEPWDRTLEGEERGGWGTGGISSFTIEVKFNAVAVAPSIVAYANVEEANRSFRQYPVRHIRTISGLAVVNGVTQMPNPLKELGLFYRRLHFASALITSVKVQVNKVVKWEDIPRALVADLMTKRGMALQANTYSLAFDLTSQQLTDQLATFVNDNGTLKEIADFRIEYTGSGAGTVDVVHELYQIFK